MSPATVRNHVQHILGKLGVHSRLEAAAYVTVHKAFVDRTPRTTVHLAPAGRAALTRHVENLIEVLRTSERRAAETRRRSSAAARRCRV